ncbi:MAG: zinc carboxypeptidase [Rhodothermales bacterium]|nr:zinc carboxypeptidase [Rhodothermales bacterium]
MLRYPSSTVTGLFFALLFATSLPAAPSAGAQALRSPSEFLGYELGSRFTPHHRVMDYVRHADAASPLVSVISYGESVEHRELSLAFVASEANHARLEDIRTNNLALAGLADGQALLDVAPALVWLSYNVHGNESVSTEAAMQTLFELADPANASTKSWIENTVVVIDPAINPDGRDRYVNWYNRMVGAFPDADPDAVEHDEPWPGGRTNHYYFDLNRDWAWLSQKESRLRVSEYNRWLPHVHVDFHEQGINSPYFFAPAAQPYHPVITEWQRDFQEIIGRNHARYFDREGWLFFTKQVFDLFYPGYGDTFPTYNGAIGMTYEQAGSGRAGLGVLTATGDTLTLADRIAHHHTTGLSTVEAASVNRDRVVREFRDYFSRHLSTPPGDTRAWVVRVHEGEIRRVQDFARHLEALGIQTAVLTEDVRVDGFSYRTGVTGRRDVRAGDLVIPAAQPKAILAKVLLEPDGQIPDSLTYDITAWSLAYAYDLDAVASRTAVDADAGWTQPAPGSPAQAIDGRPVAWLIPWGSEAGVRTLASLLRADISVRFSEKAITLDGRTFAPGVLVIARADNRAVGDALGERIRSTAGLHGAEVVAARTGFVDDGPDLGSGDVLYLKRPRIGVPFGSPASSSGAGEVWHYFDERIEYPVTRFPAEDLGRGDLDDYDVIVLPGGNWGGVLDESGLDHLRSWIRGGGRLVALGSGAGFLAGKEGFALKEAPDDTGDSDAAPSSADSAAAEPSDYATRDRERLPEQNPGAIFRVRTDPGHPLAFGFREELFVLRRSSSAPPPMDENEGWNVGVVSGDGLVSGHVGYEARESLRNTLSFGMQRMGSGSVTYLPDDPLYRGFWYSGRQLFANAVFLSGQ